MKILKANRILNKDQSKATLREWIVANYKFVEDKLIIVACHEQYTPNNDDTVGVLFDGNIKELANSPAEYVPDYNKYSDNYLTQEDLDRCTIKEVESFDNDKGVEIIVENYL